MEKIRISSKNKFFADVVRLYELSFPKNERRSTEDFCRVVDDCRAFHIDVFLDDNGRFAGFLSSWEWDDIRYGEHFAVEPSMRCGGIGSRILKQFLHSDCRPLIIEVEPPTDEMSERRIGFYRRHGMKLWDDVDYEQPPYGKGRAPIALKLMTFGDIELSGSNDRRVRLIRREVYGAVE